MGENTRVTDNAYDVAIIGAGIMGLLSAYKLRQANLRVVLIDAGKIGGSQAASSGITRSVRNDYENPQIAKMAYDSFCAWQSLEKEWGVSLIDRCGCLNVYDSRLSTTSLKNSYAMSARSWLARDNRQIKEFSKAEARARFEQLSVDLAVLDVDAGLALPRNAVSKLKQKLSIDNGCDIFEYTKIVDLKMTGKEIVVNTSSAGQLRASKLIIAAGLGTSGICQQLFGDKYLLPISAERPFELKYFFPKQPDKYNSTYLPVFAFLDEGIYGHPIVQGETKGVKIGYYSPPGYSMSSASSKMSIDRFVNVCLPDLALGSSSAITDVDQCSYDMTPDNQFILGYLGDSKNVFIAAGFNGTGYKFSPIIANIVKDAILMLPQSYDIDIFSPNRFLN